MRSSSKEKKNGGLNVGGGKKEAETLGLMSQIGGGTLIDGKGEMGSDE